jgi:hypothetical protein
MLLMMDPMCCLHVASAMKGAGLLIVVERHAITHAPTDTVFRTENKLVSSSQTRARCTTVQGVDGRMPAQFPSQHRWIRPVGSAVALVLASTFVWSVIKVVRKYNSPRNKRKRTVDLNKV